MTLIEHIEQEIDRVELEITYGKSTNRGHLPSTILDEYRKKVEILKNTLIQLDEVRSEPYSKSNTTMDHHLRNNQLGTL